MEIGKVAVGKEPHHLLATPDNKSLIASRIPLGGCNFAVRFPVWDILSGTARFGSAFEEAGVSDQLPPPEGEGRDYGKGFWMQQWLGLKRMIEYARRPS